jgi:hypothetical protein
LQTVNHAIIDQHLLCGGFTFLNHKSISLGVGEVGFGEIGFGEVSFGELGFG